MKNIQTIKSSSDEKSELPPKPDGEPVENLSKRHKAESKAKSTETAKAGDEVQPSHLWQPLKLWKKTFHHWCPVGGLVGLQLTKYSWFSKEDVQNGDILLVGIVVCWFLIVE